MMTIARKISRRGMLVALLLGSTMVDGSAIAREASVSLEDGFRDPPNAARPRVWWHWMNGNITEEGIRRDLEWMKRVGIGGLQNFDAHLLTPQVVDKRLIYMDADWQKAFRYAARLADQLGLEFAIASSPGWSETGGPWVRPEQAIKKFVWSETIVAGGRRFSGSLARPPAVTGPFQDLPAEKELVATDTGEAVPEHYADTVVVAYRLPDAAPPQAKLSTSGDLADTSALSDGWQATSVAIPADSETKPAWLRADYSEPQTIRAATLGLHISTSLLGAAVPTAFLEASTDGINFRRVAEFPGGGVPQHTISFPPVTARSFRVRFGPFSEAEGLTRLGSVPGAAIISFGAPSDRSTIRISEFALDSDARVNRFEQKAGFGVVPDYYALATPVGVGGRFVPKNEVVDLTGKMTPDGRLDWTPPAGRWKVLRFGYSLTGKRNHPATVEATGLEVDKLDRAAVKDYIETYLDNYLKATGPELLGKRGVNALLNDSIEVGAMNWTGDMIAQFRRLRGYDPMPWLPVLTGAVVEGAEESDAFLYDFRRTIGDLLADSHYAQISESVRARGMVHYAEALEFGRPSLGDDMAIRRSADVPMAAMWTYKPGGEPKPAYQADMRGAASVAHVYGQNLVAAESLTSAYSPWAFAPADLKPMIDMEFALGVNRPVIHTSVHQPIEKKPGLSLAIFGQYFNRHESWADQAKPWVDYMSRSAFLLQQGRFVADVAYFYGEEAPLTGLFEKKTIGDAPEGHGYDFVNADVLLNQFKVEGGQLTTPAGARYRALYLGGSSQRMTLPVLRRLSALVEAGAVVVGAKPLGSPSLADDQAEFAALADRLWGGMAPGRGRVIADNDIDKALRMIGVERDFDYAGSAPDSKLMFVHRRLDDGDIYFVTNRTARAEAIEARFRVTGKRPEIWRAETGKSEPISYRIENGHTVVPLQMKENDAFFVVFRKPAVKLAEAISKPEYRVIAAIDAPWSVHFEPGRGAPDSMTLDRLAPLDENANEGIRYFSGTACYSSSFDLHRAVPEGEPLWLDLGKVGDLAEVLVNGRSLGITWLAPHRVDIAEAAKPGRNSIEVRVTNLWVNRLIGDAQPGAAKIGFTTLPTYMPDAKLRPSGLMGPVTLLARK